VHISYFFDDERIENGLSIVKSNERKEIIGDLTQVGYRYETLTHRRFDNSINPFVLTLPGEVAADAVPYNSHEGEELIYVLEGNMTFCYGDNEYSVTAGDCLYFNSIIPHRVIRATQEGNAKILAILFLHSAK
jgi:mannose-6-phosphate isomerase-like protein (cupin superfamily)